MNARDETAAALARMSAAQPRFFRAPGRVNLIGEHVDYCEGFVLPLAIDRATTAAAAARADERVRVHSLDRDETEEFSLTEPGRRRGGWIDYVWGTALALQRRGIRLSGADIVLRSSVPIGAGLSSSAALEVAAAFALLAVAGVALPAADVARAAREAENDFIGLRSGIMDQLAATMGRRGHALLIDCRTEDVSPIALPLDEAAIVVCDSQVHHELAASAYNERRAQCEEAAELLRAELPAVRTLRDVSAEAFARTAQLLPATLRRRARHVITENLRVRQTAEALRHSDLHAAGARMNESHDSLRDDYEVSVPELDVLVEAARSVDGVYGARMTGGGFGGSTVTLLRRSAVPALEAALRSAYWAEFGRDVMPIEVRAEDGAAAIS